MQLIYTHKTNYYQNGSPIPSMVMKVGLSPQNRLPTLRTISASLNNNLIPVRMPYPAEEEE
jgi:hypothetical protein